jgi:putative acetyltransferase
MTGEPRIRPIRAADDPAVAQLIREVMTEFGAVGCGYSIEDEEVDSMYAAYPPPRAAFFVVAEAGRVLGCGGMGPLAGADDTVCEMRKMYFRPALRGRGLGSMLLEVILDAARTAGYRQCYLETLERMEQARALYAGHGFRVLDEPMGDTGHGSCNHWMLKDL